jgi:hypothetical protein
VLVMGGDPAGRARPSGRRTLTALQPRGRAADANAVTRSRNTIVVALLAIVALAAMRHTRDDVRQASTSGPQLTAEIRDAGLRFGPAVAPADRALVLREIATARPEARRLIGIVDGLATVYVGKAAAGGPDAVGLTQGTREGFDMTLDLGGVWSQDGDRGVQRLVLHELGHVVDGALVGPELGARLDALIPRGYDCDPGRPTSGCAVRQERFAETFAKWCTGDIGFNLPLGYKVQPPASLEAWGAQLVSGVAA